MHRTPAQWLDLRLRELRNVLFNPAAGHVQLHIPDPVAPDPGDRTLVERIFRAYGAMKDAEREVKDPALIPSAIWRSLLETAFAEMTVSWREQDLDRFHNFLTNFGIWPKATGIENPAVALMLGWGRRSLRKRRWFENETFYRPWLFWQWMNGHCRKEVAALEYPRHGNQCGAFLEGRFVGPGSFANEHYASILEGLIAPIDRPVIAELGGGYGKLPYFLLRNRNRFMYVDFDLPEVLSLATYFLMKCWPGRNALLFGESDDPLGDRESCDLVFLPHFEMGRIRGLTVDLFFNKNSLGEMRRESIERYLGWVLPSTRFFFHMNHELRRRLDSGSLLASEYPVPEKEFRRLWRTPDPWHALDGERLSHESEIFVYLYERMQGDQENLARESLQSSSRADSQLTEGVHPVSLERRS